MKIDPTKPAKRGTNTANLYNYTLTARHTKSIDRLAWQLEMPPKRLIARILKLGILRIDNELSQNCEPLEEGLIDDFNCTKEMDAMTFDRIAEIVEMTGKDCQEVFYERWIAKNRKERITKEIVTNTIPFFARPRFAI